MGSTTPHGLRYPEYATGADPKRDIQYLAEDVAPRLHRAEPLTGAQITAIASPRIGQLVANTDTGRVQFWNGTAWRNVGGGASGAATLGTLSVPASPAYLACSYFIGVGFDEISFIIGMPGQPYGIQLTASGDASGSFGIGTNPNASAVVFAAASATDAAQFSLSNSAGSPVGCQAKNIRLGVDGFLRFDLGSQGTAFTANAANRITWRAR